MDTITFTRGVPATERFPLERVAEAAAHATLQYGAGTMQYTKSYGFLPLREALAAEYNTTPDNILVSNGSLQIVDMLGHVLAGAGSTALVEAPTYDRALTLIRRHGASVIGVPIGADGPDMDALEQLLTQVRPAFMYVIADFQNPSGATLSLKKREQLVALAETSLNCAIEVSSNRYDRIYRIYEISDTLCN